MNGRLKSSPTLFKRESSSLSQSPERDPRSFICHFINNRYCNTQVILLPPGFAGGASAVLDDYFNINHRDSKNPLQFEKVAAEFKNPRRDLEGFKADIAKSHAAYPVVHLDFSNITGNTLEELRQSCTQYMASIYKAFYPELQSYLSSQDGKYHRKRYVKFMSGDTKEADFCQYLLADLIKLLRRAYQQQVVVIIDAYDSPLHRVKFDEMCRAAEYLQAIFTALKDNENLRTALITGVLPIPLPNHVVIFDRQGYGGYETFFDLSEAKMASITVPELYEDAIKYFIERVRLADTGASFESNLMTLLEGGVVKVSEYSISCRYNYDKYSGDRLNDIWRTLFHLGLLSITGERDKDHSYNLKVTNENAMEYILHHQSEWLTLMAGVSSTRGMSPS